jgi:hypothetical protein
LWLAPILESQLKTHQPHRRGVDVPNPFSSVSPREAMLLLLLGGLVFGVPLYFLGAQRAAGDRPPASSAARPEPGAPWGRLLVTTLSLERPVELQPDAEQNLHPTRWHFPHFDATQTAAFLAECGVPAETRKALVAPLAILGTQGCVLTPPPSAVLELTPQVRAKIYEELGKSPPNVPQRNPFRIQPAHADRWFSDSELPADKVELLQKLTYLQGDTLCFSDAEVARHFLGADEFRALLRALSSTDALLLRLRLEPGDAIEPLARYWGRGGRVSAVRALLHSVAKVPGGAEIDVAALLPPLPRAWLYGYPDPPEHGQPGPDCYWSSLNFFHKTPDDRFLNPVMRSEEFRRHYEVVPRPEQLGDIIVFIDAQQITQHACVYVAEDIVFTKNGTQLTHPWIFMRLPDVQAIYADKQRLSTVVFRRRGV